MEKNLEQLLPNEKFLVADGETWLTTRQLSRVVGISEESVQAYIHPDGFKPYRRMFTQSNLFKWSDLLALLEKWDTMVSPDNIRKLRLPQRNPTPVMRERIRKRDQYRCRYCGEEVEGYDAQTDHVFPFRRGGTTTEDNLVTCCRACNRKKGNLTLEEAGMALLPVPEKEPTP